MNAASASGIDRAADVEPAHREPGEREDDDRDEDSHRALRHRRFHRQAGEKDEHCGHGVDEHTRDRERREQEDTDCEPEGALEQADRSRPGHELLVGDTEGVEGEAVATERPSEVATLVGV